MSASEIKQKPANSLISLQVKDLSVLHSSYMPFLNNGGMFIPTTRKYEMNDEVFVLLTLLDESEKIPVNTSVAWITPEHEQGGKTPGIGLQFSEKNSEAKNKIDNYLADFSSSQKPTYTL